LLDIKKFREEHGAVSINLGSNRSGISGWINIDNHVGLRIGSSRFLSAVVRAVLKTRILKYRPTDVIIDPPPNLMIVDLSKGKLPFDDNTVDYVYTSHFLEHLPRYMTIKLLTDVRRTMKPGGLIRIVVPDLETLAIAYVRYKEGKRSSNPIFARENEEGGSHQTPVESVNAHFSRYPMPNSVYVGLRGRLAKAFKTFFPNEFDHKWMYDFDDMRDALNAVGFKKIKRESLWKGEMPDIKKLDKLSYESLYVEARK